MVALGDLMKRFEKLVVDNSPTILTAIGVTGTLTTAYLTAQATFKAAELIYLEEVRRVKLREQGDESPGYLLPKDAVKLVWKLYIPTLGTAALTMTAIICSNRINSRRAAAVAVAYSITEKAFAEYRDKVVEKIGEKKEEALRSELAQARVDRDPVGNATVIIGEGRVLCYEEFTGRFFYSDMEALRRAENDINAQVINDSYAALSDLYDLLNLPHTSESSEVGWNLDRLLKLEFSPLISEGRPCISVGFSVKPIRGFARLQ